MKPLAETHVRSRSRSREPDTQRREYFKSWPLEELKQKFRESLEEFDEQSDPGGLDNEHPGRLLILEYEWWLDHDVLLEFDQFAPLRPGLD